MILLDVTLKSCDVDVYLRACPYIVTSSESDPAFH